MMVAQQLKYVAIVNIGILRSFMYCCVLDGNNIYHRTGGWVGHRPGPDRCGKIRPIGIRFPDGPARSESLYRLRYSGPAHIIYKLINIAYRGTIVH